MSLEQIEADLERATELAPDEAATVLETARQQLQTLRGEPDIDHERRESLETSVEQRLRQLEQRDSYDSSYGAALNTDEDNAP